MIAFFSTTMDCWFFLASFTNSLKKIVLPQSQLFSLIDFITTEVVMNIFNNRFLLPVILLVLTPFSLSAIAAEKGAKNEAKKTTEEKPVVYGWELMTPEERKAHREKMRSFKTAKEREEYRKEHHKKMQARAKAKGMKLPYEEPGPRGKGMGQGGGRGAGGPDK
jgi:hypothetical protein